MTDDITDKLPIGRLTIGDQFLITGVDETFRTLFGGGDELLGRLFDDLISDRDRRGALALADRLNRHRGEIIDLSVVITAGGRDHFVRMRLVGTAGQFVAYIEPGDNADTLTHELTVARQRWAAVLHRSDEGIVLLDRDGTIIQHNARFFELMQFRTAHGVALTESALHGRALAPMLAAQFAEVVACLARGDEEFAVALESQGRALVFEGRSLRIPVRGRVETLVLVRDLSEQKQIAERDARIQADLDQAAKFQGALLARSQSPRGLEVDVAYRPLDQVGGDLYDVCVLTEGTVRIFIADATGHGVTAALSTMLIKSEYDAVKDSGGGPGDTLRELNDRIARTHRNLAVMFTAAIVDISPDRTMIRHACGAHPGPLLVTDTEIIELPDGGPFLGAAIGQTYPEWARGLGDWRGVTVITDGVLEARNAAGGEFGVDRLRDAIGDALARNAGVGVSVLARLDAYVGTRKQLDDITMVTIVPRSLELPIE